MLKSIVDWLVYSALGLRPGTRAGEVVEFFLYDSVKILVLLFGMMALGIMLTGSLFNALSFR